MKTRHLLAALAALLASAAPVLASNTGITIQIPAAVTSVAASDVTVLDTAGYFAGINVESVLAELQRDPFVIVANTAALPLDEAGECDGFALALVSTETGGPLLYRCAVSSTWTPILVPVGPITSSQLTMATARLLGRTTASTGAIEEVSVSSPLTLAAGALGVGTVGVANGGTGAASLTAYAPVCGGTTTTAPVQSCGTGIGTVGYVWTSNGASALPSWQAASGGGTPGGSTTQVQFNDSGSFGGDAGMTYDKTTDHLTILGGLDARGTAGSHPETTVQIGNDAVAGNNYGAWGSVAIGFDTDACAAGTTNSCIAIGTDAHATTNNTLALGRQLTVSAGYGIGIGFSNIQVTGGSSIAIGDGPQATGSLSTAIGPTSTASGYGSWALGITSVCAHTSSWCIGNSATSTAANQLILGGTKIDQTGREDTFKHVYIGSGVTNANPLFDVTLHGTGASGTNVGAKDFYVAPGLATGNAASGSFIVQTGDAGSSGATAQTGSEKFRVPVDGGIRVADPGTRPACDSAHRGTIWYDAGGSGVADTFAVCGKSAADTYSWVASATF